MIMKKDMREELESFEKDINSTSFALSLSTDISDQLKINVGLSSVERAPTAVELSNGWASPIDGEV